MKLKAAFLIPFPLKQVTLQTIKSITRYAKKKKKGDDYPCLLIINFPMCMQYKHKSGKQFRRGACKSIVLLSSSGGTLYLPNAIRQDEPLVN